MPEFWKNKNPIAYSLWPLSWIYRFIFLIRKCLYDSGFKKKIRFPVPVIVVGNLTVGGTGKTSLIIYLANLLRKNGFNPGIVSRGYHGVARNYPILVTPNSQAQIVGDEPLLIAQKTDCPVVIDPKRTRAARYLLQKTSCDLILSDDGLQHFALERDLEIVVIDGQRLFGNGFYIPAGPLREPITRLKSADFVLIQNNSSNNLPALLNKIPYFNFQLKIQSFYQLIDPNNRKDSAYFQGKNLYAVTGIGNPQRYFQSLQAMGLICITHAFVDHYLFKAKDFEKFDKNSFILMTEKDAVKCVALNDERLWVTQTQTICDPKFFEQLINKIGLARKTNPRDN
jgi:tetraacyldisaccharide 4'-kinase